MPAAILAKERHGFSNPDRFEVWASERRLLETALDDAPENTHAAARERIFDRLFQLERLIFETESLDLAAIRIKADLVLWTMTMEQADALPAMRHIRDFLHRVA